MTLSGKRICEGVSFQLGVRAGVAVAFSLILFYAYPAPAVATNFALKVGGFRPAERDLREFSGSPWSMIALEFPVGQVGKGKLSLETGWLTRTRSPEPRIRVESDIVSVTLNYTQGKGPLQWGMGVGMYYVGIVQEGPPIFFGSEPLIAQDATPQGGLDSWPESDLVLAGHIFLRYGAGALFTEARFQMVNANVTQGVVSNQNGLLLSLGYWFGR